jgi:hypothetical protein
MPQQAVYRIKISKGSYSRSDDSPAFRTGQGSTRIWNFNSSVLFETFGRSAYGATYYSTSGSKLKIGMTGFVDDDNCNSCEDAITHEDHSDGIISRMRYGAQLWHDLLWTSGGALELTKCQYYLMDWDFTIAGAPILNTGTNDNHIDLISPVGDELCIKQLGCGTLYKTLGIFVNQTPPTSKHGV